jgi:TusA-related sulfurtransferase
MTHFKTLDSRGQHFGEICDLALRELKKIKIDGILEIILDNKRNISDAIKAWAKSHGHQFSDSESGNSLIRIFIRKCKD